MRQILRRRSLFIFLTFCAFITIIAGLDIYYYYQQEREDAEQDLKNSTYLIGEWIKGAFQASDNVLRDIVTSVEPNELKYPHPQSDQHAQRSLWLAGKRETVSHAYLAGLFNRDCILTHVGQEKTRIGFDASQRDYCRMLKDQPYRESIVTPLFMSNLGRYTVTQSRRFGMPGEKFTGLATLGMGPELFAGIINQLELEPDDVVTIVDQNLRLVARKPTQPDLLGKQTGDAAIAKILKDSTEFIILQRTSSLDGKSRLVGIRKISSLPFIVAAGKANSTWKADWYRRSMGVITACFLVMIAAYVALRHYWAQLALQEQLEAAASTDMLTGVLNRRAIIERAEIEISRARRHGTSIAITIIDIDYFKEINDRHGHAIGDQAIIAFVSACTEQLRNVDVFGRYGGDEFVLLLTDITLETAKEVCERVRQAVADQKVVTESGALVQLGASIGGVVISGEISSVDEAIKLADAQLYRAKHGGRNQVCIQGGWAN